MFYFSEIETIWFYFKNWLYLWQTSPEGYFDYQHGCGGHAARDAAGLDQATSPNFITGFTFDKLLQTDALTNNMDVEAAQPGMLLD
jgi:hypothetical protein